MGNKDEELEICVQLQAYNHVGITETACCNGGIEAVSEGQAGRTRSGAFCERAVGVHRALPGHG